MTVKETEKTSFSSKLSESVWGHRFMDGQRGPEYVLEFLNVMAGTEYTLDAESYKRKKMTGFRRFVFEGSKEGRANEIIQLNKEERKKLIEAIDDTDKIDVIKEFFRNLEVTIYDASGKPTNRSWYAKTLYPLHESLLFFEVRKKGDSIGYERNFFARGGELYYLMLSMGTQKHPELKVSIENRLSELLSKNKPIETIVKSITSAIDYDSQQDDKRAPLKVRENDPHPYLPENVDVILFESFAKEFNNLINLNIEMYEMFNLMNSLVTFQIMRYLLDRVNSEKQTRLFIDAMDGQIQQIMKLSSESFSKNELLIKNKYEQTFKKIFDEKIQNSEYVEENLENWKKDDGYAFFQLLNLGNLHKKTKERAIKVLEKCKDYDDIKNKLFIVVKDIIDDQLKKHQIPIMRGLVRDGGLGGFRTGTNYRYFLTDNFLKILVFSNVAPDRSIEFSDFMEQLYEKYGIIIGEVQAKKSGLYEESKLNVRYFQRNEQSLRSKLQQNGLLVEYSDATAMIRNPYKCAKNGVNG
ncbi:hypothetical protein CACET_c21390 [Clostridium aceticum]|uniref:Uncharacterized protein n=1 Tax=Clostridium aceticum TaxID=84022 RepID=A0A0D8I999_9CLOT|nr:hypothetical protein [Clostridium aceticum]AKL95586.1 hypothetical protein CACET_c21390 [Clostridium aceticum]KJF26840.1 hypothetical protein TZ02_11555 [Clostridium aceticum]